jgi:hypothetical protein
MTASVRGIAATNRGGQIDAERAREYSVVYYVETDDRDDGPLTARTAFGIPNIGDMYITGNDADVSAVVVSKRATQRESPYEWEVEVVYSTDTKKEPQQSDSPLDEPPRVSVSAQTRRILVPGYFNTPSDRLTRTYELGIVNTAGEYYDPQPEMDITEPVLVIERNYGSIDLPWLLSISNCVNQSEFYGVPARMLRMAAPRITSAYDGTIGTYWNVVYEMAYKWDTWDIQLLSQGTYSLYAIGGGEYEPKQFLDKQGHPRIGLLDENGYGLNASDGEEWRGVYYAGGDEPYYQTFRVYGEIDFNSLGII